MHLLYAIDLLRSGFRVGFRLIFIVAHAAEGAAAIDVMVYACGLALGLADADVAVAQHQSAAHDGAVAAAAAIDVAHGGAAKVPLQVLGNGDGRYAHSTAADINVGAHLGNVGISDGFVRLGYAAVVLGEAALRAAGDGGLIAVEAQSHVGHFATAEDAALHLSVFHLDRGGADNTSGNEFRVGGTDGIIRSNV